MFEAVGIAGSMVGALIGPGLEDFGPFELHGFIHEDGDRFGHAVEAFSREELDELIKVVRLRLMGHVGFLSRCD